MSQTKEDGGMPPDEADAAYLQRLATTEVVANPHSHSAANELSAESAADVFGGGLAEHVVDAFRRGDLARLEMVGAQIDDAVQNGRSAKGSNKSDARTEPDAAPTDRAETPQRQRSKAIHAPKSGVGHVDVADSRALVAGLKLSPESVARAVEARRALEATPADAAEGLLERLAADEIGVSAELQGVEGAAIALIAKTLLDPELTFKVLKVAHEISALSDALRGRLQRTFAAVADLRAQRNFLAARGCKNGN